MIGTTGQRQVLFGLPVDPLTMEQTLDLAQDALASRRRLLIGVINAAKVAKLQKDPFLRDSILACDVTLADGQSIVWASRLLGRPLPERVAGIDLFEELLDLANMHRWRVFFLGARADVLGMMIDVVSARWPDLVIAGAQDGYFKSEDSDAVAQEIREARPDLLFLGMTTPAKEIFLGTYADSLRVPILHGVGGSFDVLAGVTRRAPRLWQHLGMEWAYRVKEEPRRLWRRYLVTNIAFLGLLVRERFRRIPEYSTGRRAHGGPND